MNVRAQTWFLLAGLAGVAGLWAWSRTQSGQSAVGSVTDYLGNVLTPRGIRNNNAGNVERSAISWQGSLSRDQVAARGWTYDETFEQMDTPASGVRMIGHVLKAKAGRGLVTVNAIIRDYSKTDQDAYVAAVSDALGVQADDPLDVVSLLPQFAGAIIQQENGQQPYDPASIAQWVYT